MLQTAYLTLHTALMGIGLADESAYLLICLLAGLLACPVFLCLSYGLSRLMLQAEAAIRRHADTLRIVWACLNDTDYLLAVVRALAGR